MIDNGAQVIKNLSTCGQRFVLSALAFASTYQVRRAAKGNARFEISQAVTYGRYTGQFSVQQLGNLAK